MDFDKLAEDAPKVYRKEVVGTFEVSTIIHKRGWAESMIFNHPEWDAPGGPNPYATGPDPDETHAQMVAKAQQMLANGERI